jgi:hypothetical protein
MRTIEHSKTIIKLLWWYHSHKHFRLSLLSLVLSVMHLTQHTVSTRSTIGWILVLNLGCIFERCYCFYIVNHIFILLDGSHLDKVSTKTFYICMCYYTHTLTYTHHIHIHNCPTYTHIHTPQTHTHIIHTHTHTPQTHTHTCRGVGGTCTFMYVSHWLFFHIDFCSGLICKFIVYFYIRNGKSLLSFILVLTRLITIRIATS